ncbi:MAG TPA: excinuclease ABC subunit B, partial [Actinomycetospora sp.]
MAFATEVPGAARDAHEAHEAHPGTLLDNPEGLPDDALAESEFRPISEIERTGEPFEVVSPYQPAGDQPAAIDELERRVKGGEHDIVLLGATGTGKSATTAWLIERLQRPTLV